MTFPLTPLAIKVELLLSGVWTDITSKVYQRDGGLSITRGRRSEGSTADPSSCTILFNNRDGRFSPRNPNGIYYGTIGRNTRVRVSVPATSSYLDVTNAMGDGATCPDSAGLSITGDLDLQVDAWLPSWSFYANLIGKYNATGNQRSYEMFVAGDGILTFAWSTDGVTRTFIGSTVPVPAPFVGRKAVRATFDVNNGIGGYTLTFYTSDTIAGSWTQLGDAIVTTGGTTSIFDSTSLLYVGSIANGAGGYGLAALDFDAVPFSTRGRFYAAKVLSGIAGTEKANPVFTTQSNGTTSFADAAGNTWTVNGASSITGKNYRFQGEISEWPARWDVTGKDIYVPVTASGITRRLGNGTKTLKSAYYRSCTSVVTPVTGLQAYWPCEDAVTATSIASGFSGQKPIFISGIPVLAADSSSFLCSDALPTMGTASFTGKVVNYVNTGQIQVRFLLAIPATGITNGAVMMSLRCGGTAARWELVYTTAAGGTIGINVYDSSGSSIGTATSVFALTGTVTRITLGLTQNGGNVDWVVTGLTPGNVTGGSTLGTQAAATITTASQIVIAPNKNMADATIGHVSVQNAVTSSFDLINSLAAYNGETATARFQRLCTEENIDYIVLGSHFEESFMGTQTQQSLLDLLHECETTDAGILYEPREIFGLAYRSTKGLSSQATSLTLNYANADLSSIEPTEDDRTLTNDVTATRATGSSARYTKTSGVLSTQAPPNGIGVYDSSVGANVWYDTALSNVASWRVHLGTVDEARYPILSVNLARSNFVNNAALTLSATTVDVGDRITVTNPPTWLPPETINQLAVGMTEVLNAYTWTIDYVCQPESPYEILVWSDSTSRYSTDSTTTVGSYAAGVSPLIVFTPSEQLWGHGDGNYDIIASGERMTVTAVATAQLLTNPTFDSGITDWQGLNAAIAAENTIVHSGAGAVKSTSGAGANPRVESGVLGLSAVTPGEIVTASGWIRVNTARSVSLNVNWFDAAAVYVSTQVGGPVALSANTYTQLAYSVTAPTGIAFMNLGAVEVGTPGAGLLLYLDDASLSTDRRQSLTVTRAVNGVAKTIPSGSAVTLFDPSYWGL